MDIVDEAKELIPWLDDDSLVTRMTKHIEYLRLQNERLRQQNAELVEALHTIFKWQPSSTTQPRQKIIDSMQFYAHLSITKATGGE